MRFLPRSHRPTIRILALLTLLATLSGCALNYRHLDPPTAQLLGVSAENLQEDMSLGVIALLRLDNPNDVALPVEGGQVDVTLNGQPMATGTLNEGFELPAHGSANVELPINVDLMQAITLGLNVMNSNQNPVDWQLKGHIDLGVRYLGRVYFDESGRLSL